MEALLNSTDDMMWSVDRELRLLAANETFFKSTEAFSGGRLKLGDPVLREDLFTPELIQGWKAWYQKVLAGEKIREEHHVPAGKNSEPYWWEIWLNPITHDSQIVGVACFGRTITRRKEMELALLESQEVLKSTIESPKEMIILSIDRDFRYLSFNSYHRRATFEAYGTEIEKGKNMLECIPVEAEREKIKGFFELAFAGESFTSEERYGSQKQSFWETRYSPILDAGGKCVGATAISINVTARKIAEEARQESEDRLRMIFRTLSEGVALNEIICDADGAMIDYKILEVNDAFYKVADYDRKVPVVGSLATKLYGMTSETIRKFWEEHRGAAQTTHAEYQSPLSGKYFMIATSPFANNQFVTTFHDITARKKDEEQIRNLVYFDTLTQLPNRRLLIHRLEQSIAACVRHRRRGGILFIDLDFFKSVNDSHGHAGGDQLLSEVASRIKSCVREGDTVARLAGDEFVVMLEDLSDNPVEASTQTKAVGEKILSILNAPYHIGKKEHHSTASLGATLYGDEMESFEEPLKRADLAMYRAKSGGRNTLCFFDPEMQVTIARRVEMENGLRQAIEENHLVLFYQAQVTEKGSVTGVEALIRWKHPSSGFISPASFIPLAEETGLILPLGQWVLETACAQLVRWAETPGMEHLTIAVNVSPRQFNQENFVPMVVKTIKSSGARAELLKLELTEGMLLSQVDVVIKKMTALKMLGVQFSLDDFGTGYSSLSYLKKLPLDQLKIDQSFVKNILFDANDAAIARMVIALAESLGLAVIAEGVETAEQRDFLRTQNCLAYQGYFFSRPEPVEKFEALARQAPS